MNALQYAILGLIDKGEVSGYDLTKVFNDSVADFWNANHSQIYPELKRLTENGMIEYKVVIQGEVLEKKIYSITTNGRKKLQEWLSEEEPDLPQSKDIFKLRFYFAEHLTVEQMLHKLEQRRQKCERLLERYRGKAAEYQETPVLRKCFGDYVLLQGAMKQLQAQLEWLNETTEMIRKMPQEQENSEK